MTDVPAEGGRATQAAPFPRAIIVRFTNHCGGFMPASYNGVPIPADGAAITYGAGGFVIPDNPIIPFIEGDGTGRDIWRASRRVFDAAVQKAYGGRRHVAWYEVFAGEKAFTKFQNWLPQETV